MDVIKLLAVIFAASNFYYFVYPENKGTGKRFLISLAAVVLLSFVFCLLTADTINLTIEGVIIMTGYFLILFCVHLLVVKVFKIKKYMIYQFVFAVLFFLATVFYTALMQDIFRFS